MTTDAGTEARAHGARLVVVHPDAGVLAEAVASRLLTRILDIQSVRTPVHVVLTGGTVGIRSLAAVAAHPVRNAVDWTGVHVWWGDERFLPAGDPERNETQAREALLDHLPTLPAQNVHVMAAPGEGVGSPEESAALYADELSRFTPDGAAHLAFDVLLLGMGPDGHVASLFPGNAGLAAEGAATGVRDSPKPPPERVSLTFSAIQAAQEVWVVAAGAEKAPAVASALAGDPVETTPAAGAIGTQRTLWLVDLAASSTIS
jgi:6-phosphogluconolactonase